MCDSYNYTRLCAHFFVVLMTMIKYINFEYIILVSPRLLVKIRQRTQTLTSRIT